MREVVCILMAFRQGGGGGIRVPLPIIGYSSLKLSHLRTAFYYNDLTILDIWDTIIVEDV